jgi:hypothetical protein
MALALCAFVLPAAASADVHTYTYKVPTGTIEGYTVKQGYLAMPHPQINGFVTHMDVNVVDADGNKVPIQHLMLHHIVFSNLARQDPTCDNFLSWDNRTPVPGVERFYGAGEERNVLDLPPGYGYKLNATDPWFAYYMFMNHRAVDDSAYIQYHVRVDDDPNLTPVRPYWLDVKNCLADPVYNVAGDGGPGSTTTKTADFVMPHSGRIIAGGGHVHGGGIEEDITEPDCGNRQIGEAKPTWGMPGHQFYNVHPILHEPGPINMSGWGTPTGIPVKKGETLRLHSVYDDSRPHMRVMGISVIYVANDSSVDERCGPIPNDIVTRSTNRRGRPGPIPFKVPLTGLNSDGQAVSIDHPPGPLKDLRSGSTIDVGDRFYSRPNVEVKKGSKLDWKFSGEEPHNVTLANGPIGVASRNLDSDRVFSHRFKKPGTYKFFCALHPVQMSERVIVDR